MAKTKVRYEQIRVADLTDDQKTAAQILLALSSSATQEDLQEFELSQIKRIIFGNDPGNWYLDFVGSGIKSLKQLTEEPGSEKWNVALLGVKNGLNAVFTTPDKFLRTTDITIRVFLNGVKLTEASDYTLSESGGAGTGYDTVTLLRPKLPLVDDALSADYHKDL